MTTKNIEWLIGRLRAFSGTSLAPALMHQAADTLQSQAERIAELERESETHSKAYGLAIVERDNLRHELKTAQEGWRCECSTDDACRFARERDALRAELAQQGEQAKPVAYITDTYQGPMVWTPEMYDEACTYCDDGEFPVPLYTAAPAPQAQEPAEWRTEAVKWIRRKAEDQRATNEQNPRHAEAYPSWGERVRQWHWLADDLELEQNSPPFGLEPYQEPAPQAQERSTCNHCDGTGWVVRDPDIGTDQECFVCDGSGYVKEEPAPQPAQGDIVETVIGVLSARRGFDEWWDGIDEDLQAEITQEIRDTLQSAQPVAQPLNLQPPYVQGG